MTRAILILFACATYAGSQEVPHTPDLVLGVNGAAKGPSLSQNSAEQQTSVEELAKKSQNPLPDEIKVQFQNYFNFGTGPDQVTQYLLNLIPNVPFKLTEDWNLITRTDFPIINQPALGPGLGSASGLGDINSTLYLVPRNHGTFVWGLGPSITIPTATDSLLGAGKWSAGPAAVVVLTSGPWVLGTRLNSLWSFAGWGHQNVNELWIQPFVHYNFSQGWYLCTLPTYTANWEASHRDTWTVPVGGGLGKHLRVGALGSLDLQIQAFKNVERPVGAPDWQLLFQVQVLFPKH